MELAIRSGQVIEVGACCGLGPPGHGGQHTAKTELWWRVPGGEWRKGARTMHGTKAVADVSDSIEEFAALLEIA